MVDTGKANEACSKGLNERLNEDRISQLPDPLICLILSHLPTKVAVITSVLSTRWTSLWLWVPRVELTFWKFPNFKSFMSFGDKFLHPDRVSPIHKLELVLAGYVDYASYLTPWIDAAIKRKIQHLEVHCPPMSNCEMPLSLYNCETLVHLKLSHVPFNAAEFVSFPCLKTMNLECRLYPNEPTFERLVSSCPVLEDLKILICGEHENILRVHSRSLKKLTLQRHSFYSFVAGVTIDAPLLRCLSIVDHVSESFIANNLDHNSKLYVFFHVGFGEYDDGNVVIANTINVLSFIQWISMVRDVTICAQIFELMYEYAIMNGIPQFDYMSRLCVSVYATHLFWLPIFLRSCPNLKSITLRRIGFYNEAGFEEIERDISSTVPQCLLTSLEFVEFKTPVWEFAPEMELVRYFLENCVTLKKLTLRLDSHSTDYDTFKKLLLKLPRGFTDCQVAILIL